MSCCLYFCRKNDEENREVIIFKIYCALMIIKAFYLKYFYCVYMIFSIDNQLFVVSRAIKLRKHFVVNIRSIIFAFAIKICWL